MRSSLLTYRPAAACLTIPPGKGRAGATEHLLHLVHFQLCEAQPGTRGPQHAVGPRTPHTDKTEGTLSFLFWANSYSPSETLLQCCLLQGGLLDHLSLN